MLGVADVVAISFSWLALVQILSAWFLCQEEGVMGLFDLLKNTVASKAGVKTLQLGSNILISRYTSVEPLMLNKRLLAMADEMIKAFFLNEMEDMREEEAALIKLVVLRTLAARSGEEHMEALFADAVERIMERCADKIRRPMVLELSVEQHM
jgi:hypothetical protein